MNAISKINLQTGWKPIAIGLIVAFLYATVLSKLGFDWWNDENYSHGLLVPFVIGFIIWNEFDFFKSVPKNSSFWLGGSIILLALLTLLAGTLGAELFVQRISLVLMLIGIVVYFFGANLLRLLVVPFLLLLFAIPIPQIIFNKIAIPLQFWASQLATWGIRIFEVPSVRKGNVIEILPRGSTQIIALEVVEACSGIRSLMTLVTLALVLWYFTRENKRFDWIRAIVLMFSAIPMGIVRNAARVTGTGVLTYHYGKQSADSFTHEFSGWLVYLLALVLLWLLNFVLKRFFRKDAAQQVEKTEINYSLAITNFQIIGLIAALFCGGLFINWFEQRGEAQVERKTLSEIPAKLGDWNQKGSDLRFSEQTESVLKTTEYITRDYTNSSSKFANVYVGYYASQRSGATYHSPQNCLPGAGWEMKNPELIEITTPSGKTFTANRYLIQYEQSKAVMIYWYQGRGRAVASEYSDKVYTVLDSVLRQRSDGAMVRIWTPDTGSDAETLQIAVDLSAQVAETLPQFVPD